ncbi:transcriptional regulator, partial [Clostridium perfringens]
SLAEKLLGLISTNQQDDLVLLNQILLFEGTNPHNPDLLELSDLPHPMLEKLIQNLLTDSYLWITIEEAQEMKSYPIYLLHLYHQKGVWLMEGFDLQEERKRLFPVDGRTDITLYPPKKRGSRKKIMETLSKQE